MGSHWPPLASSRLQSGERHAGINSRRHVGGNMFDGAGHAAICFFAAKSEQRFEPGKTL